MYALNYDGLRKRDTYEEIIDYLLYDQEKIKYPNRLATRLRNSHELSNLLDGEGEGIVDIEQQQRDHSINIEKDLRIRQMASQTNQTAQILRVNKAVPTDVEQYDIASSDGEGSEDIIETYDNTDKENERARAERNAIIRSQAMNMLSGTGKIMGSAAILLGKSAFDLTYGVAEGVASTLLSTEAPPSDSSDTDDDVVDTPGASGSSNDDLDSMRVPELRTE